MVFLYLTFFIIKPHILWCSYLIFSQNFPKFNLLISSYLMSPLALTDLLPLSFMFWAIICCPYAHHVTQIMNRFISVACGFKLWISIAWKAGLVSLDLWRSCLISFVVQSTSFVLNISPNLDRNTYAKYCFMHVVLVLFMCSLES